jgi:hypothetical protein
MAKQSGLPSKTQVDDAGGTLRDISNDINSFELSTPSGLQDITGLDKSAIERLLLLADGKVSLKGTFNPAANMSHIVFRDYRTIFAGQLGRTTTVDPSGISTGAPRLSMELIYSSYDLSRGSDGSLTWSAEGQLADGTVPTWITVP